MKISLNRTCLGIDLGTHSVGAPCFHPDRRAAPALAGAPLRELTAAIGEPERRSGLRQRYEHVIKRDW